MPFPVPLPADALDLPVAGQHLSATRFADLLGPTPTLFSFLRHLG